LTQFFPTIAWGASFAVGGNFVVGEFSNLQVVGTSMQFCTNQVINDPLLSVPGLIQLGGVSCPPSPTVLYAYKDSVASAAAVGWASIVQSSIGLANAFLQGTSPATPQGPDNLVICLQTIATGNCVGACSSGALSITVIDCSGTE
jgi:hypothetical protein